MTSKVDAVLNWSRKYSMYPYPFVTACCGMEFMSVFGPRYDIDRFGSGPFRATPRQCDLMIVAGTVTHQMASRVKRLYDQMAEPKYVISMGSCANAGGPYWEHGYSVLKGVDKIIPVDVYVTGCPPRPEALLDGLLALQARIKKENLRKSGRAPSEPTIIQG